jgi:hypothetical protein
MIIKAQTGEYVKTHLSYAGAEHDIFYGESKPFLKTGIKIRIRVKSNVMLLFQAFTVLIGDPLWSILWRKHYEIFVHPFCLS